MRSLGLCVAAILLSSVGAFSQSYMDEPGIPAFTTSFPVEHGFINLANGALHIEIPIAAYAERGGTKTLHARLVYNSRFWMVRTDPISENQTWQPNGGPAVPFGAPALGWSLVTDGEAGNITSTQTTKQCRCLKTDDQGRCLQPVLQTTYTGYSFQEADGTNHRAPSQFKLQTACGGTTVSGSAYATDNSGYLFVISGQNQAVVYASDGTLVSGPVQDTNGNFYSQDSGANVIDTLGRTPVIRTNVFSSNGTVLTNVYFDYLCEQGCNPSNSDRARVTLNISQIALSTQFNQNAGQLVGEYSGTGNGLQSIVFPDGSTYSFTYDSYGQMTSMTLPTGGTVSYGYTNFSDYASNVNRWVNSRTVDGQTWNISSINQTCTGTPPCTQQVTLTTPSYNDGSTTVPEDHVYTFEVANGSSFGGGGGSWNTQVQFFRGSASSGTLVVTKTIDYGFSGACPAQPGFNGPSSLPIRETLTWPGSGNLSRKNEYCYDSYANVTAFKQWDYQPNGAFGTTPDRETDTTYVTDPSFISANILRLKHAVTILDGAQAQVAQTTYGYDEGSIQSSGVTTQHTTPTVPRANLTSVGRWLSTTGANVTSTTVWYDTGEAQQAKDPLLNPTTYTYDSLGALPIKTCNALSQCSYSAFDANTGVLTSFTDANGSGPGDPTHTTTHTYDSMLRPLCTNTPDGGQTCLSYPNTTTVQKVVKITSSLSDTSSAIADSLGRLSQTQHITPGGIVKQDTTYDPLGAVATVSNPYISTSDPTYGVTQNFHDSLGRPVETIRPDGSIAAVQYSANCSTTTDEAGKPRRNCHNAFGGVIEVDEPQSTAVGTNATASVTISGSVESVVTGTVVPVSPGSQLLMFNPDNLAYVGTDGGIHQPWGVPLSNTWHMGNLTGSVLAASNSPLVGYYTDTYNSPSTNTVGVYYVGTDQHLHATWYENSNGQEVSADLTGAGGPNVSSGSQLLMFNPDNLAYIGTSGGIYQPFGLPLSSTWHVGSLTGSVLAAPNSPLVGYYSDTYNSPSTNTVGVYYVGTDQHLHATWYENSNGQEVSADLTGAGGPNVSSGSQLLMFNPDNLAYVGTSGGIYQPFGLPLSSTWHVGSFTGSVLAAPNSPLVGYYTDTYNSPSTNTAGVYYVGTDQHLHATWYENSNGQEVSADLTGAGGPNVSSGSQLLMFNPDNLAYVGTSGGIYQPFGLPLSSTWHVGSLTGSVLAAPNSPLVGYYSDTYNSPSTNTTGVYYVGTDQHLHATWYENSNGQEVSADLSVLGASTFDSGTVSLNVGGFTATACFGNTTNPACANQPVNTTLGQVASALAQAINVPASPATATVSGSNINLTWKIPGAFSPAVSALTTTHDSPSLFPNPSFTSQATSFSGGTDNFGTTPYVTLYSYDALGNLLGVNQKGDGSQTARVRSFTYDSLSRLLTATNPESGTISYSYDANNNLLQKISPAPNQTGTSTQAISYCYDALNRVTGKAYSAQTCTNGQLPTGTAVVTYGYDSGTNGTGRLTSLSDQAGSGSYAYDVMGRITAESRTTATVTKNLSYVYNLDGSLKTLTYPSNSVLTYTPDSAGRMLSAVDVGNAINYVTSATYGPDSSLTGFVSGNSGTFAGISNSFSYNKRLQPVNMSASSPTATVFSIDYDFHFGNGDNGDVFGITNYRDTTRNQTFTYDALNRLTSAQNSGTDCSQSTVNGRTKFWGNNYGYDPWGNLLQKTPTKCGAENLSVAALANNQLVGYSYDSAGNMTHDATTGNNYSYDQENRITGAAGFTYTYDADGNRVEKSNGATGTIYWYMSPGIVAESDLTGVLKSEYIFFDGERIARKDFSGNTTSVFYYFSDHLKTASVITDSAGTIKEDEDYYPWGGELQFVNNDSNHYKFTSKERDSETGLDYFGSRYYGNWLGRFMTPDDFFKDSHVADPQSWNEYAYARNNPLRYVDPTGENATVSTSCSTSNNQTTCNVNISASIAIYAAPGSGLTQGQLDQAASTIQNSIQNAWTGSFTQDGVTYNVTTQVSVSVATSEEAAMGSGAQNVIGMTNGPITMPDGKKVGAYVDAKKIPFALSLGPDKGMMDINGADNYAKHEFTHMLGTGDKPGGVLSNTDPAMRPNSATPQDYGWGIREATTFVKAWVNAPSSRDVPNHGDVWTFPKPSSYDIRNSVGAPMLWWK